MKEAARRSDVTPYLEKFQGCLSKDVPKLELKLACDWSWGKKDYEEKRPEGFPSRLRGVYLISNPEELILYVGLAMWNFDKRVWAHQEIPDQRWVDIVAFEDDWVFLAPALEFFLIKHLKPPFNETYREY